MHSCHSGPVARISCCYFSFHSGPVRMLSGPIQMLPGPVRMPPCSRDDPRIPTRFAYTAEVTISKIFPAVETTIEQSTPHARVPIR